MSRYQSLCKAVQLMETMRHILRGDAEGVAVASEIITDLQDIAKDVRYGGKWVGNYEKMAEDLEACTRAGQGCMTCAFHDRMANGCRGELKKEAAACIRQMASKIESMAEEISKLRWERGEDETATDLRKWQEEDMARGNRPPERFPWEE